MGKGLGADDGVNVPPFLFGGADEWFTATFGKDYETTVTNALHNRNAELVAAFESVTLMSEERSSMNDIGGIAQDYAKAIRAKTEELASEV